MVAYASGAGEKMSLRTLVSFSETKSLFGHESPSKGASGQSVKSDKVACRRNRAEFVGLVSVLRF